MATARPAGDLSLPVIERPTGEAPVVALVGNPNAGKTSLFNRLTGLRAQTANFAGTTVSHRRARVRLEETEIELVDLPGLYSLNAVTPDEQVACAALEGTLPGGKKPNAVLIVLDATNLQRHLFLAGQVLELGIPTLIALNMTDIATRQGLEIDAEHLSDELGCPVVAISARRGDGMAELNTALVGLLSQEPPPALLPVSSCGSCNGCSYSARYDWAERIGSNAVRRGVASSKVTDAIDRVLAHKVWGLAAFGLVMLLTFVLIFKLAAIPMDLIDGLFATVSTTISNWLPAGDFSSLVTDGLIAGVGGILVFVPQIAILFFLLALLEDSGYLSRAAFVMDRLMHRVGLPGKAFVPMLSAHACAIPAIMATRVIEDRRDRLATILVAPLMTCSARVPVYAMVVALLFGENSWKASLVFAGAYALGIVTALIMAWVLKKTILPGKTKPLVIELPSYRLPSLRNVLLQTWDRTWSFIKNAGTVILVISVVMWALATYPKTTLEQLPAVTQTQIAQLQQAGDESAAGALLQQSQLQQSFAGRIGRTIEPVFAPLGFDWKMSVGIISSFAAREVIVSTLSVLYGLGDEADDVTSLTERLRRSTHADGTPVFTTATCLSLLVFYVLAMQCLPTQAVTKVETGGWKWPAFQLGYMSILAYLAALTTYQVAIVAGLG